VVCLHYCHSYNFLRALLDVTQCFRVRILWFRFDLTLLDLDPDPVAMKLPKVTEVNVPDRKGLFLNKAIKEV
jgi:hypothetical protein